MLVERREYALAPCRLRDYWDSYERWNRWLADEGMLSQTLAFLYTVSGPKNSIVNLSTFDSFEHKRATFERIYRKLSPAYVETVRPWYLSQESTLFEPSPIGGGSFPDEGVLGALCEQRRAGGDVGRMTILETRTDLRANGLAIYAKAFADLTNRSSTYKSNLLGSLQSISGRLFRMIEYRWFADSAGAEDYILELDRDADTCRAMHEIEPYVVETHAAFLKASPVPWMRPMFELAD
jgi:hypothetical protein